MTRTLSQRKEAAARLLERVAAALTATQERLHAATTTAEFEAALEQSLEELEHVRLDDLAQRLAVVTDPEPEETRHVSRMLALMLGATKPTDQDS